MKKIVLFLLIGICITLSACDIKTKNTTNSTTNNSSTTQGDNTSGNTTQSTTEIERKGSISEDARVGYQIFVPTFSNGDSTLTITDGSASGDIKGITNHLDYLKNNLNVDVLWLTPIHDAQSYHGYDVIDYKSINPGMGTMDDYKKLLTEAHKRNIYVMLDLVINHTSSKCLWFQESSKGASNPYRNYYRWSDTNPGGSWTLKNGAYYLGIFWDQMPDLNFDNPVVYNEMLDVCKYYLDMGVDGFRVDGAKHVYNDGSWGSKELTDKTTQENFQANLDFFENFSKDVKEYDSDCFLTLEVLEYDSNYVNNYYKTGVDSCFDFNMRNTIVSGINDGNGSQITSTYTNNLNKFTSSNSSSLDSVILSNHDIERVYSSLGNSDAKAKCAASIQLLLPGLSWIYNGDELGMSGSLKNGGHGDLGYRMPYKWGDGSDTSIIDMGANTNSYDTHNQSLANASLQEKDANSMLSTYKTLTSLKGNDPVIKFGDYESINLGNSLCSFTRTYNNVTYLVVTNTSSSSKSFEYDIKNSVTKYSRGGVINENGGTIEAYGTVVVKIQTPTAVELNQVVIHYDRDNDYKVWEWSTVTQGQWISFTATDSDGNRTATIDISNKNLLYFNFVIAKDPGSGDWLKDGTDRKSLLTDPDSDKVAHLYVTSELPNLKEYSIDIDTSWDIADKAVFIWAWGTNVTGSWNNATVVNNKLVFSLDAKITNCVICVNVSGTTSPSWSGDAFIKQSKDLTITNGELSSISWK